MRPRAAPSRRRPAAPPAPPAFALPPGVANAPQLWPPGWQVADVLVVSAFADVDALYDKIGRAGDLAEHVDAWTAQVTRRRAHEASRARAAEPRDATPCVALPTALSVRYTAARRLAISSPRWGTRPTSRSF